MARSIVRHSAVFLVSVLTIFSAVMMWITVENAYADVERPDLFYSEYLVEEVEYVPRDEHVFTEVSDGDTESVEHFCNIVDMKVKSQTPQEEGQEVVSIDKDENEEYYRLTALSLGSAEIEVTFVDIDDPSWERTETYNIEVVSDRYEVTFWPDKRELLPGEETGIETEVLRRSYDGYLDIGDVEYEWTIEAIDHEDLDAEKYFEISNPRAKEPIIRVKSIEELLKAFPDHDPDEPFITSGMVKVIVKSNGEEVASCKDRIDISDSYFVITPDRKQAIELNANELHKEIELELKKAYLDSNGNAKLETVPAKFEIEKDGEDEDMEAEITNNKLSVRWKYDGKEDEIYDGPLTKYIHIYASEIGGDESEPVCDTYYEVKYNTMGENPVELEHTDNTGKVINDEDRLYIELFNDDKCYFKLTKSKKYNNLADPSVKVFVRDRKQESEDWTEITEGYTYNEETGMVILDGKTLWDNAPNKEDEASVVRVMPVAKVNGKEKYGQDHEIDLRQARIEFPEFFEDETLLKGDTVYIEKGTEWGVHYCYEYSGEYPDGKEIECDVTNCRIVEQNPMVEGKKVLSLSDYGDDYELKARNFGKATVLVTFQSRDDKSWIKEFEYNVSVVDKMYSATISTENESDKMVPGEQVNLKTEVYYETLTDKGQADKDLTYEWSIENEDGLSAKKCFEIVNPDNQNPTIRAKKIDELKEIFKEKELDSFYSVGSFCLSVKKYGREVARKEIELEMSEDFYELTPGSRTFEFTDPTTPIVLNMELKHVTLGEDGERKTEIINDAEFDAYGSDTLDIKVEENEVTIIPTEPEYHDFTVTAFVGDEDSMVFENSYELMYREANLYEYIVYTAEGYPLDAMNGTIDTDDIKVKVKNYNTVLSPDEYNVKFIYCGEDDYIDENVDENDLKFEGRQLNIKDQKTGASYYRAVILPKEGSGYEGIGFSNPFAVYYKNSISAGVSTLTLDQTPLPRTEIEEDYAVFASGIEVGYDRYLRATTENKFILETLEGDVLQEGKDYTMEFYERDPEEWDFDEDTPKKLEGFPTTAGTYMAKAVAKEPSYRGEAYFAFDLADPIGSAQVTGISSKTYTGKRQTQNPTVKLGGKTLRKGVDYELTYKNNVKPGKAVVTIVGKWKYAGNIPKVFTINKAAGKVDKPRLLNVFANTSKKLNTAKWKKVPGATGYEASWRTRGAKTWSSFKVGAAGTTATANNQKVGALYEYKVRATKKATATHTAATSSWSNVLYRYYYTVQKIRTKGVKGGINVSWAKDKNATGYQILYTTSTKYTDGTGAKIYNVSNKATSATIKGLQKGKTYQVQIRAIKKVGGTAYIGNLSSPIMEKVK